jgi:hypothetical protein
MDFEKDIGTDLKVDFKVSGGKAYLTIEFDGADAALDALKAKLPSWLSPLVDLAKVEIDKV